METRTPLTLITGPLGSGKTTLLRYVLTAVSGKLAILMNEFGEISIDAKILRDKNIEMADLGGGCVCCSLLGEFEAALNEMIDTLHPDRIVVETTGVAEPDALVFDIQESLTRVRLDGVVTVIDADSLIQYPQIGHTARMQIEAADIILLNKIDLVSQQELAAIAPKLNHLNVIAAIIPTIKGRIDPELLFGIGRERIQPALHHVHQPEFESFSYTSEAIYDPNCFTELINHLDSEVYCAKGFVQFPQGTHLFNFVAGRWDLEPFESSGTELVFIGKQITDHQTDLINRLKSCEQ